MGRGRHADWHEERRLRAYKLKRRRWSQAKIAEALGVTAGAVSQWMTKVKVDGKHALRAKPRSGAPPKLNQEKIDQMLECLARGAETYGFYGDVWTCARVATLIEREFGVQYHKAHVSRLLKRLGISPQKPVVMAAQRDEAEIERWRKEVWPRLKKSPSREKDPDSPR